LNNSEKLILGIDASRNRSGGARAHLIGMLSECDPEKYGIKQIHVWAPRALLNQLPDVSWLIKHNPPALEASLLRQLIWQAFSLAGEVKAHNCSILFATDASTLCRFIPLVVLGQDMLSYEPGVMAYFGYSVARLRLLAILIVQNLAFKRANGVIFLTRYAGKLIQQSCGKLQIVEYIPHGVDKMFNNVQKVNIWPTSRKEPIRCIYVSGTEMYKHQWVGVRAFALLKKRGYDVVLDLVGGGEGTAVQMLQDEIEAHDVSGVFVRRYDFLSHDDLPMLLAQSDLFVFASSCENMPVTLLEAMAVGLPIACSNCGPMPEILADGGVYFDPKDAESVAKAIEEIILSKDLRLTISERAKALSQQYTWERCANETFAFIVSRYHGIPI
jgi:glycosyltransferase involved in cell wall biosynthesis